MADDPAQEVPLDTANSAPNEVPLNPEPITAPPTPLEKATAARMEGYSWPEIDGHVAAIRQTADQFGYSQDQVDTQLGYNTSDLPYRLGGAIRAASQQAMATPLEAATDGWVKPTDNPDKPFNVRDLPDTVRHGYAQALLHGETTGPTDFSEAYIDSLNQVLGKPVPDDLKMGLSAHFPTPQDAIDLSIGVVQSSLDIQGQLPGQVHLDPQFPTDGVTRPFAPGEYLSNPDGSWSNEMTYTVPVNGKPSVVPGLWLQNGKPIHVTEDQATELAEKSGLKFPSFDTEEEAEKFSQDRENKLQNIHPGDKNLQSLWTGAIHSLPLPLQVVDSARTNMINAWSQTGVDLYTLYQTAHTDPFLREALVTPQQAAATKPALSTATPDPTIKRLMDFVTAVNPQFGMTKGFVEAFLGKDLGGENISSSEHAGRFLEKALDGFIQGIPKPEEAERIMAGIGTDNEIQRAFLYSTTLGGGGLFHGNVAPPVGVLEKALADGKPGVLEEALAPFKQTLADTRGSLLDGVRAPRAADFGEGAVKPSEMDMRLRRLTGSINAGSLQLGNVLRAVPDEWREDSFQNKVGDEVETRLYTPGTQMARGLGEIPENTTRITVNGKTVDIPNEELPQLKPGETLTLNKEMIEKYGKKPLVSPETQEYLDGVKELTDMENELGKRVADKMGKDGPKATNFIGVDDGYMHRIWDQKQLASLDPNVAMELTSGTIPPNKLSTFASSMEGRSDNMYVFDHGDGTRVWGTTPLDELGINEAKSKPGTNGTPYEIGDTIETPDGKTVTISRPTMKEIEANTPNFTGSHNHLINTLINVDRLQKIDKVLAFIADTSKDLADRGQFISTKEAGLPKGVVPRGYVKTEIPGLKGYMDPRIANPINDYWNAGKNGDLMGTLNKISQWIINPMFLDPIPHIWNMSNGYLMNRAADWINPVGYVTAIRSINTAVREIASRGPIYQEHVAAGSGLPFASQAAQNFRSFIAQKTLADMKADEGTWGAFANSVGLGLPDLYNRMQNNIHSAMWWTGEVMKFSRELEWRAKGYPLEDAISLAEKDMASYQLPSEVLGSHVLSQAMKQPVISPFARFHYALANSVANFVKDITGPLRGNLTLKGAEAYNNAVAKALLAGAIAYYQVPFLYNHGISKWVDDSVQGNWKNLIHGIASTSPVFRIFETLHNNTNFFGNQIVKDKAGWQQKLSEGTKALLDLYWPAQVAMKGMDNGWGSALDAIFGSDFSSKPYIQSPRQQNQAQWDAYNEYNHSSFIRGMTHLFGGSPQKPAPLIQRQRRVPGAGR